MNRDHIDIIPQKKPPQNDLKPATKPQPKPVQQTNGHVSLDIPEEEQPTPAENSGWATSIKSNSRLIIIVVFVIIAILLIAFFVYQNKERLNKFIGRKSDPPQLTASPNQQRRPTPDAHAQAQLREQMQRDLMEHRRQQANARDSKSNNYADILDASPESSQNNETTTRDVSSENARSENVRSENMRSENVRAENTRTENMRDDEKKYDIRSTLTNIRDNLRENSKSSVENLSTELPEKKPTERISSQLMNSQRGSVAGSQQDKSKQNVFMRGPTGNPLLAEGILATEMDRVESDGAIYMTIISGGIIGGNVDDESADSSAPRIEEINEHNDTHSEIAGVLSGLNSLNSGDSKRASQNWTHIDETDTKNDGADILKHQDQFENSLQGLDTDTRCIALTAGGDRCKRSKINDKYCGIHNKGK